MSEDHRTPEVIFDATIAAAEHPKSIKAMGNVKAACDDLDKAQLPITIAGVGKITSGREGGPTTPSLRNNKAYVAYVHARSMQQKLPLTAKHTPAGSFHTNDPEINAVIYMLEARCKAAESKLRCVTKSLASSADYDLGEFLKEKKMTLAALPPGTVPPTDTKPADGRLGEALAKLFNTKHIEPFGLVLDNERLKSAESLRVLLDKSDVQALRAEIERQRQQGQGGNGNS